MKKTLLPVCMLLFGMLSLQAQTVNVTFKVNMKVQAKKGFFKPATDKVTIPGDFDNWLNEPPANTDKVMDDADGDSIYTKIVALDKAKSSYEYKYNIGLGWDGKDELGGKPNRKITTPAADSTLDAVWFNDEQMPSGAPANVTFEVNMKLPVKQVVNFSSTQKVWVAGSFTDWGTSAVAMTDANNDSIYTVTTPINSAQLIQYKFIYGLKDSAASKGNWESLDNRIDWIVDGAQTISKFWDDKNPNIILADGNIFFEVNMSVATEIGVFNPNVDSVQIRGEFNGWNDSQPEKSKLNQDPGNPNSWYLNIPFVQQALDDSLAYKFFIKNPAAGTQYSNTGWEVPIGKTVTGDRNRPIVFKGIPTQEAPIAYFEGIHPDWVIPTGVTVKAEFSVDMTPATQAATQGTNPVFNPATDTVYWIPRQPLYYALNKLEWNLEQRVLRLLDPDGDKIYKGTLTINGPAFNGFLYNYAYTSTTGFIQEDGGQGGARVRFIGQTGGPRKFDSPWTMPNDVWTNGEKPEEAGPLTLVRDNGTTALTYELHQNYPNPFNPSTTIKFEIKNNNDVTLKVFNLLGQEVATLVNEELASGSYGVNFDGKALASGVYIYRITAGNYTEAKRMLFLK
jgi:hypothetical protein